MFVLGSAENQMSLGHRYALKGADGAVNLFQTVGGIGDNLQNVIEIAGETTSSVRNSRRNLTIR